MTNKTEAFTVFASTKTINQSFYNFKKFYDFSRDKDLNLHCHCELTSINTYMYTYGLYDVRKT
jgi:hypothetical protein